MKLLAVFLLVFISYKVDSNDFDTFSKGLEIKTTEQEKQAYFDSIEDNVLFWSPTDQGRFYHAKGLFIESKGNIELAKATLTESIRIFEKSGQPNEFWVMSLNDRSYMDYLLTNDTKVYCPDRVKSLEIARLQDNVEALIGVLTSNVFCMNDDFDGLKPGLELLAEATQAAKENQLSEKHSAMIHNATGLLYKSNQLHEKAYEYLLKAYHDWLKLEDVQDMFNMQHGLVGESISMNKWAQADEHVKVLFEMAQKYPDFKDFTFFAYFNQGRKYYSAGDFEEAVRVLEQALLIKETTSEQYFVDFTEAMWVVAKYRSGTNKPMMGLGTAPSELVARLKGNIKLEFETVWQASQNKHEEALFTLWKLSDQKEKDKLKFTKNNTAALSMSFDQEIHKLQKQSLQDQLDIKDLELAREVSNSNIIKYTRTIIFLVLILFVFVVYFLFKSKKFYQAKSQTDFMTGLYNRRSTLEQAKELIFQAEKYKKGLGLLIFDIDDFKEVNDEFGHITGDKVIKSVASSALSQISDGMVLGRIGGEEFILIIPNCDRELLICMAEKIRIRISSTTIHSDNHQIVKTVSLGLALHRDLKGVTVQDLMKEADTALYVAKNKGKNQHQWASNN